MQPLKQLIEVTDLLDEHRIQYWLDSGTLLGIIREGSLLPSDHDIDLSAWWEPGKDLRPLQNALTQMGYRVNPGMYQGQVFKFWLRPLNIPMHDARSVDLRFFRTWNDEYAWSPRVEKREHFKGRLHAVGRGAWWIWKHILRGRVSRRTWPVLKYLTHVHCWWIPVRFFEDVMQLDNGLRVPREYEQYLHYRYGDWRTPVPDWDFKRDDPTYKKMFPEELFKGASAQ